MKSKTIEINGKPFTYMDEVGDPYEFGPMTPKDMNDVLTLSAGLLNDCGIPYILAFGTLLGAVREGDFIKGDGDVDLIVTDEEKLFNCLPYLYAHGLFLNRIFKTELYTFHTEGKRGHVDMYIMHPIENWFYKNRCVSVRGHYAPKRFFESIVEDAYHIGETTYPCPKDPENLLAWWYGKTWRIPQSKKAIEDVFIRRVELLPSIYWRKGKRWLKRMFGKV